MNAAKRVEKRVATLKRGGPAWRLDEEAAAPFRSAFGGPGGNRFVAVVGEQKCGTTLVYDACRARAYHAGLSGGRPRDVVDATPDYGAGNG